MSQIGALFGGLWGDAGLNFVNEQGGADKVFGTKPEVAPYTPIDLSDETGKAVAGNLANYPSITELLDKIIPGFSDNLRQGGENTGALLRGEIPQDVQDQIYRSSAFKSIQGGYGGTPMAGAATARDLGLNSLQLQQMGNNSAQIWSSIAEQAYSPFTVSTGQQAGTTAANNAGEQAQKQYEFNVAAAPDPGSAGIFGLDKELGMQMLSMGMGAAGGAMGGAGGGAAAMQGGQYAQSPGSPYQLYGGTGSAPAYQYNSATGQFGPVPVAQGAWGYSDRRLKKDLLLMHTYPDGLNVYEFNYIWEEGPATMKHIGVMADEVQALYPEAVREVEGYFQVDYARIGMEAP